MIKKILLVFNCFILFIVSSYSISQQDIPNQCLIESIDLNEYNSFKNITSFKDIIDNISMHILTTQEYKVQYSVFDPDLDIDLTIRFLDRSGSINPNNVVFGNYLDNNIKIYVGDIKNWTDSKGFGDTQFQDVVFNTVLHEIAHYVDVGKNLYLNATNTFLFPTNETFLLDKYGSITVSFSGENNYKIIAPEFYNYFQDNVSRDVNLTPLEVPLHLRNSVNFTNVFNSYAQKDHAEEVIGRISALCLHEVSNGVLIFDYVFESPNFCDKFNFQSSDGEVFTVIANSVMQGFFYANYPQHRVVYEDGTINGLCLSQTTGQLLQVGNNISKFLNNMLPGVAVFLFSLAVISSIVLIVRLFPSMIKRR